MFRSNDDTDNKIPMLESSHDVAKKIICTSGKGRGRRKLRGIYYPRCTKSIDFKPDNMPFGNTIGEVIGLMSPKCKEYFRYCIGFGPWYIPPELADKTEVYEVQVCFETRIYVEMTFSHCQQINLIQAVLPTSVDTTTPTSTSTTTSDSVLSGSTTSILIVLNPIILDSNSTLG